MSIQRDQKQNESFVLGGSVYGGRPTFALVRNEDGNDIILTLYELLPTEQADARCRRLERNHQQSSKIMPLNEVIDHDVDSVEDWTWDGWVAMKVRRLSGARLRSILQLIETSLQETKVDPTDISSTGEISVLIPEGAGVRLTLGFIGVKPLQRVDRMRSLSRGVARMSLEECYYWHAKCRSPTSPNGAKAFRMLFRSN